MTWTLCTSGSAIVKAGVNANTVMIASGSLLAGFNDEVESYICDVVRYDVVTNYATIKTNGKMILSHLASSLIAQNIIGYDPDAIGRSTANLMLNILENNINKDLALLKEDKIKTYLTIT